MKSIAGFLMQPEDVNTAAVSDGGQDGAKVKKSLVQIHFQARNMTLTYFNDSFDLHCGDIVYVDGKLEGLQGRVVEVNYNFKIKISDYKRVIGCADTDIRGQLYNAGSHFAAFDSEVIPFEKVSSWFMARKSDEDEYVSGNDETSFMLDDLQKMNISSAIAERGIEYYQQNRVRYLCINGTQGKAIVEGTRPYEVDFDFHDGEILNLVCDCFCCGACKHEFAVMLQLRELLNTIREHYNDEYARSGYFAAVSKAALFSFVIDGKTDGGIQLS